MNVPDSSAWIEYFRGSPLKTTFRPIVQDITTLIVPSIVIYEVYKWMVLDVGEDAALIAKAMMLRGKVIVLDPSLAIDASRISIKHKLAMADAIIYATTLAHAAEVWTTDGHFKGLPNVRFFEKN
jgi:predicted nucleic acid-binding protein